MLWTARAGCLQSDAQCGCGIESGTRRRSQRLATASEHRTTRLSWRVTLVAVVRLYIIAVLARADRKSVV